METKQSETETPLWQRKSSRAFALFTAALVLAGWLFYTPAGVHGKAEAIGYAVCHRINTRSFWFWDTPMALCARCTGMYLGAVLGLVYQGITAPHAGRNPPWKVLIPLGIIVILFGLDGVNSLTNLFDELPSIYTTTNVNRIFTGTGFGIAMAVMVYPSFNQTVWKRWERTPAVPGFKSLGILLLLGVVIALVVLWENPYVLFVLSFVSAAGVIILLTMVYTMLALMLTRTENAFTSIRQMAGPLLAGLTIALLQIASADLLRFLATGTWEGFHIHLG